MRVDIVVPQVGEAVAEVTLVRWLKAVGDNITKGDVLFEVDIDKSVIEVEAFDSGRLVEIIQPDGAVVTPRDVVGILETS